MLRNFFYVSIISFLLLLAGCKPILKSLYGIQKIKTVDTQAIAQFYTQNGYEAHYYHIADSTYLDKIVAWCNRDTPVVKALLQPLRAYYFQNNDLVSLHLNCYAGDSLKYSYNNFKLNWNVYDRFEQFPPLSSYPNPLQLKYKLTDLEEHLGFKMKEEEKPFTIVIVWTNLLQKQSKILIEQVLQNYKQFTPNAKLVFVNGDSLFTNAI